MTASFAEVTPPGTLKVLVGFRRGNVQGIYQGMKPALLMTWEAGDGVEMTSSAWTP